MGARRAEPRGLGGWVFKRGGGGFGRVKGIYIRMDTRDDPLFTKGRLEMNRMMGFVGLFALCLGAGCVASDDVSMDERTAEAEEALGSVGCGAMGNATGCSAPLQACTAGNPCTRTTSLTLDKNPNGTVTLASRHAVCHTSSGVGRPSFNDDATASILDTTGIDGTPRSACIYEPSTANASNRKGLLIFFHGTHGSAQGVYDGTLLRAKAAASGFYLVSVQGRNLHWPSEDDKDSSHHDIYYRDVASPSTNPDIDYTDRIIDWLVTYRYVDPRMIHVTGWSNGGFFAELYAIARHTTATPNGNRVASAAVFSAGDPFQSPSINDNHGYDSPVPVSSVPIYNIGRACDIVACNATQLQGLRDGAPLGTPSISPNTFFPGADAGTWINDVGVKLVNPNVVQRTVNAIGQQTTTCTTAGSGFGQCDVISSAYNHLMWPDGIGDNSSQDWENEMLVYLAEHPLPVNNPTRTTPIAIAKDKNNFDNDSKTDLALYHAAAGNWYIAQSAAGSIGPVNYGWSTAVTVTGDYDGDSKTDKAVYDPGTGNWYVAQSGGGQVGPTNYGWPTTGVVPVPADYDGDGKTDRAIYDTQKGTWRIAYSGGGAREQPFGSATNVPGVPTAVPVPGDYDNDKRADLAVYLPASGTWYIMKSGGGASRTSWGYATAAPVPGDYDGDGKTDLAVYDTGTATWYILKSSGGSTTQQWGWSATQAVPGDHDGDGKTDIVVYAPSTGTWYILKSGGGSTTTNYGWSDALPAHNQRRINRFFNFAAQ
ncbi:MAG TPA: FG-GAP-like repeat-containing protein [Polyangium sp.]|nr:FG-GAP-like repeat-containing protein [Polyangium sp.]